MKRIIGVAVLFAAAMVVSTQSADFHGADTQHYQVYSDESQVTADQIAEKMEACLRLYNGLFHFDLSVLAAQLKVRIFAEKTMFDSYLQTLISETRNDFVYIHYTDLRKSELVGFRKENQEFDTSLLHQGAIQFLKAFIPNAPIWLREGVAAYVEKSTYDQKTATFLWQPNLAWLDSLKAILKSGFIPLHELILFDASQAVARIDTFYPEAWGLVQFLSSTDQKIYNRVLWDTISVLTPKASLPENSRAVAERVFSWVEQGVLQADFLEYIQSLKTLQDHIQDGMALYEQAEETQDIETFALAEHAFSQALTLEPTDHVVHYYLGLINYSRKQHDLAEQHYKEALAAGLNTALIYYALGVNAFADDDYEAAEKYLEQALQINPDDEKASALLKRIQVMR